jgi:hypothetical protein
MDVVSVHPFVYPFKSQLKYKCYFYRTKKCYILRDYSSDVELN